MIRIPSCLVSALWILLLAGCGTLTSDRVVTGVEAERVAPGDVQVVMNDDRVPEGFREIGMVRAIGYGNKANLQSVVAGLRHEAAQIGATLVVRVTISQGPNAVAGMGTAGRVDPAAVPPPPPVAGRRGAATPAL
ncbi:MAG: hypothetical protein ACFCGT_21220 [Sandaracinaceae bacterium]